MNRMRYLLVAAIVAVVSMTLGTIATTGTASAQAIDTCCVRVDNNTDCHLTVCVRLRDSSDRCVTVAGNSADGFRFLCRDAVRFWVDGACEPQRLPVGECIRVVLRGGCCAIVCLRLGHDGCYHITINPTDGPCGC